MFDYNSILSRMREHIGDRISTIEGSFAGDILQAAAGELARIYSQHVEMLFERGFLATARGEWLDNAAGDFGVRRLYNEDDEKLRQRALTKVSGQAGNANAAQYCQWALETGLVSHAQCVPLANGAGTVLLYIIAKNQAESQAALGAVDTAIKVKKPICVSHSVAYATPVSINISAQVSLSGTSFAAVKADFNARLSSFLNDIALDSSENSLSISRIVALIMQCAGVCNVQGVTINGQALDAYFEQGKYGVCADIVLEEVMS